MVQCFYRQVATAGSTVCAALDQMSLVAGYWVQDWNGERLMQKKDAEEEKRVERVRRRCSGEKDEHWACFPLHANNRADIAVVIFRLPDFLFCLKWLTLVPGNPSAAFSLVVCIAEQLASSCLSSLGGSLHPK